MINVRLGITLGALAMIAVVLAGCATQPNLSGDSAPGFFFGLFHGLVAPLALIAGLLTDSRVYAFPNSGWWYDLGYMIGLSAWAGGASTAAANKSGE